MAAPGRGPAREPDAGGPEGPRLRVRHRGHPGMEREERGRVPRQPDARAGPRRDRLGDLSQRHLAGRRGRPPGTLSWAFSPQNREPERNAFTVMNNPLPAMPFVVERNLANLGI